MRARDRSGMGRSGEALRTVAVAAFAVVAVLAGPDAALATTDTTFGGPLDTVQDIAGGTGGGPKFYKFGNRVRYARVDVDAWAADHRFSSTSDEGGLARGTA